MTAGLAAGALLAATTTKNSSSSAFLPIILVIGLAFYFFIYRPQQRKARALREQGTSYDVGDEVLTAGGIVGYVIEVDGDRITLETSVGASFVVMKPYVIRKIEQPVDVDADDSSYDEHHDTDDSSYDEQHEDTDHGEDDNDGPGDDHDDTDHDGDDPTSEVTDEDPQGHEPPSTT
jgi:preprotein translocase subunit YajC